MDKITIVAYKGMRGFSPAIFVPTIKVVFPFQSEIIIGSNVTTPRRMSGVTDIIIVSEFWQGSRVQGTHPILIGRRPDIHHDLLSSVKGFDMRAGLTVHFHAINKPGHIL